ncbi:hypothetical protein A1D22_03925 [Pasteurellaceae bacterium LFhippo2]|nr:hypothetical protein [Pasteurellaceae bacterium LFhippo2]
MNFLKQLHKSAFLSQILLGIFAIFALPSVYATVNENDQEPIINQQVLTLDDLSAVTKVDIEQAIFLQFEQPLHHNEQAVVFCEFFANLYVFDGISIPPIRAGPVV